MLIDFRPVTCYISSLITLTHHNESSLTSKNMAFVSPKTLWSFPFPYLNASLPPLPPFSTPFSHQPILPSGQKTTTFAVISHGSAFAASLDCRHCDTSILHGEVYSLVATSILAQQTPNTHIFSDHLNSVNLLLSSPSLHSLRNNPAQSLYTWLLDIWSCSPFPNLSHV